jgi:hypothetical protein
MRGVAKVEVGIDVVCKEDKSGAVHDEVVHVIAVNVSVDKGELQVKEEDTEEKGTFTEGSELYKGEVTANSARVLVDAAVIGFDGDLKSAS